MRCIMANDKILKQSLDHNRDILVTLDIAYLCKGFDDFSFSYS